MIRPGTKVNSPAISSAPANIAIMALRCWVTWWRRACRTANGSVDQREDRQQMDRAPRAPHPHIVDPERRDADDQHQRHPDIAERPVRQRSLGRGELNEAERERRHRREGMDLDRGRGIEKRLQGHARTPRHERAATAGGLPQGGLEDHQREDRNHTDEGRPAEHEPDAEQAIVARRQSVPSRTAGRARLRICTWIHTTGSQHRPIRT